MQTVCLPRNLTVNNQIITLELHFNTLGEGRIPPFESLSAKAKILTSFLAFYPICRSHESTR